MEIPSLRTKYSDTYRQPDGQLKAVISAGPVNYRDSAGDLVPVDDSLVAAAQGGGWTNKADAYQAVFPSSLAEGPVSLTSGSDSVSFQLDGAGTAAGSTSGNSVTYAGVVPGLSATYASTSVGVSETLMASNLAAAQAPLVFDVTASKGLTLSTNDDGSLTVSNADGSVFTIPAPTMTDAAGAVSNAVHYAVVTLLSGWAVTVVPDSAWLTSDTRTWPVAIDPTVTLSGSATTAACTLQQSFPTTSTCTSSTSTRVGYAGLNTAYHSLISFTNVASAVPSNATVTGTTLALYDQNNNSSTATAVHVYPLLRNFATANAATWNSYDGTHTWTTSGATSDGNDSYTSTTSANKAWVTTNGEDLLTGLGTSVGWVDFHPTKIVQAWVEGATNGFGLANDGFLIKEPLDNTANMIDFTDALSGTSAHWPSLEVFYQLETGNRPFYAQTTHQLNATADAAVNLGSGDLEITDQLLHVPGIGMPLDVDMNYSSDSSEGNVTNHWWLSPNVRLASSTFGDIQYINGDGFTVNYALNSDGTFQTPKGMDDTLTSAAGDTYTLTDHASQEVDTFSDDGTGIYELTTRTDRNNNQIKYTYTTANPTDSVKTITDTQGRTYTFNYTSGLLTSITDSNGPSTRTWSFGYTSGKLTSYYDPLTNWTTYGYDANGNLNNINDPQGEVTQISASSSGVTNSITYGYGTSDAAATTYSYNPGTCTAPCATVTQANNASPLNYTVTYTLANNNNATDVLDAGSHNRRATNDGDDYPLTGGGDDAMEQDSITRPLGTEQLKEIDTPKEGITPGYSMKQGFGTTGVTGSQWLPSNGTDGQGNVSNYGYDPNGNPTTDTAADSTETISKYQGDSGVSCGAKPYELCSTTDGDGYITTYGYDGAGNVSSVNPPTPLVGTIIVSDGLGRPTSVTDGDHNATAYTYDKDNEVTQVLFGGATTCTPSTGNCITYSYDHDGNLTQRVDSTGTTTLGFDHLNRETSIQLNGTTTSSATYDQSGNMLTYNDAGGTVTYNYDAANNLLDLSEPGGSCPTPPTAPSFPNSTKCTGFKYNADNALAYTDYPSGEVIQRSYDKSDRPTMLFVTHPSGTEFVSLTYNYTVTISGVVTDTDLLQSETDNETGIVTNFKYTQRNQLASAIPATGSGTGYTYTYDADGNRTKLVTTNPAATTYYGYNPADELCLSGTNSTTPNPPSTCPTVASGGVPSGDTPNAYDTAGNQTATGTNTASYNALNQTTGNTISGTTTSLSYTNSGQDLRTQNGTYSYLNGLLGVASETNSADGTTVYFTRTPDGRLVSIRQGAGGSGTSSYYLTDYQGTVLRITTAAGTSDDAIYKYDPYGVSTSATGTLATINPYRYATGMYDTATGQLKLGERYYAPIVGRFTQQDPSGSEQNNYAYAGSDPSNSTDSTGECGKLKDLTEGLLFGELTPLGITTGCIKEAACTAGADALGELSKGAGDQAEQACDELLDVSDLIKGLQEAVNKYTPPPGSSPATYARDYATLGFIFAAAAVVATG